MAAATCIFLYLSQIWQTCQEKVRDENPDFCLTAWNFCIKEQNNQLIFNIEFTTTKNPWRAKTRLIVDVVLNGPQWCSLWCDFGEKELRDSKLA